MFDRHHAVWPANLPHTLALPQTSLYTNLEISARRYPDRPAIVYYDTPLTYAELDRAAAGIAAGLRERGIQPGDKVALLVPNVPEFTIAYFGILYAGAVVIPINVLAAAPEVAYFLEDSKARLLVAHALFEAAAREGCAAAGVPCARINVRMNIGPLAVRMSSKVIGSVGDTRCSAHQCSPVTGCGLQHRLLQGP